MDHLILVLKRVSELETQLWEVTQQEARAPLGLESQRQWSDLAI